MFSTESVPTRNSEDHLKDDVDVSLIHLTDSNLPLITWMSGKPHKYHCVIDAAVEATCRLYFQEGFH